MTLLEVCFITRAYAIALVVVSTIEPRLVGIHTRTPLTAAWRAPSSRAGRPASQDRHPAKASEGPDRPWPHSSDPRKRSTPWPIGDVPLVRSDRSAQVPDDREFFEIQPRHRSAVATRNTPVHVRRLDRELR